MKNDSFAHRLQQAMNLNHYKQKDLVNKTNIDKTLINKYLNGVTEAKQDNLEILAEALNVDEVWLMGYDVNVDRQESNKVLDEVELLFSKHKDLLTTEDKEYIKFIIEKRIKDIDKQNNRE